MKVVKDDLLKLLVHLLLLPEDNVTFPLNRTRLELRPRQDVGDDVHRLGDVLPERLGIVDSLLAGGVSVEVCAKVLNLQLELVLRTLGRALERHVFEEVGRAGRLVRLGAGTGVDPDTDGGSRGGGGRLGRDGQTVGEGRDLGERGRDGGREAAERHLQEQKGDELEGQYCDEKGR